MTRLNRRQLARSLLVAANDRIEGFVWTRRWHTAKAADYGGWCRDCGSPYQERDLIVNAVLNTDPPLYDWVHFQCPPLTNLIDLTREKADPYIIIDHQPTGRGRCALCRREMNGDPIWLVRTVMSLHERPWGLWICQDCLRKGWQPHDGEAEVPSRDRIEPTIDGGTSTTTGGPV